MTLLTIVQNVADEQGLATISDVSSDAPDTKLLRRLVNVECNALARRKNWSFLQEEHTFATVASTAAYSLPSDFLRLIQETVWNRSEYWQVRGATSPQEWQLYKSGLVTPTIRDRFRIKSTSGTNEFYIDPTPTSAENFVFEYVSKNWGVNGGSAADSVAANADTVLFDEYLVERGVTWRWLNQKGFPYAEERALYDDLYAQIASLDGGGGGVLDMGYSPTYRPQAILPDGGYGN